MAPGRKTEIALKCLLTRLNRQVRMAETGKITAPAKVPQAGRNFELHNFVTFRGYHNATDFFRHPLSHIQEFATHTIDDVYGRDVIPERLLTESAKTK